VGYLIKSASDLATDASMEKVLKFAVINMVLWIGAGLGQFLTPYFKAQIVRDINVKMKSIYIDIKLKDDEEINKSATIIAGINNNIKQIETNFINPLVTTLSSALIFLVAITYMFSLNILISLMFIAFSFLVLIPSKLAGKKLIAYGENFTEANGYFNIVLKNYLYGYKMLKNYASDKIYSKKLNEALVNEETKNFELSVGQNKVAFISILIAGVSFIAPFALGIIAMNYFPTFTFGALLAVFLGNDRVVNPLLSVLGGYNAIKTSKTVRREFEGVLGKWAPAGEKAEANALPVVEKITFKGLSKAFDEKVILENVDLEINQNDKILIVGESGTGKSTILKMLLGQINHDAGELEITAQNKSEDELFAYISQEPIILDGTIRENILINRFDLDDASLAQMLKDLNLEDLGLDYVCGPEGANLSGGQKQRIEIARAVASGRSALLIDEATAALDNKTSEIVRDFLYQLPITIVEIAHHYDFDEMSKTFKIYELKNRNIQRIN
jgi:ABC-type bacteriocin/lantibiotic exporter with double-glycine peptidase domain